MRSFLTPSLGTRILMQMALRVAVVIVMSSAAGYYFVYRDVEQSMLETLGKYVHERGERESLPFLNIQNNLLTIANAYLEEISGPIPADTDRQFNRLFVRSPDGAWRRNPRGYDVRTQAGSYMSARTPLTLEDKRRSIAAYSLTTAYGRAWKDQMTDIYLASMDGIASTYWPGIDWYTDVSPTLDFSKLSWVINANQENNPSRSFSWTGIWYDDVVKDWFADCILPIDVDGKFRHYAGVGISLDDILNRTASSRIEGTYNIIFRPDGRLISHPAHIARIKQSNGEYSIKDSSDPHLRALFQFVTSEDKTGVNELEQFSEYLGVTRIHGPEWYFITVFPKKLISTPARKAAEAFLWLGVISLVIELLILFFIIRKQVITPIRQLSAKAARIRDGNLSTRCDVTRKDELGELAASFNDMAKAVQLSSEVLKQNNMTLENRVTERTAAIERALAKQHHFMDMLTHELKTPISVVRMSLGLINTDEHIKRRIDRALEDINDIIERCIQLDQLEHQKLTLHAQRCDFDEMLAELRTSCGEPHRLSITSDTLPNIVTDQQLLRIILSNLINNAIKYSPPDTVIDIHTTTALHHGKPHIRMTIENQIGEGDLPDPKRLFVKYYRSPSAHSKTGSGLGLYLVRSITSLLGGQITYDAVQEKVRFTLWIPC